MVVPYIKQHQGKAIYEAMPDLVLKGICPILLRQIAQVLWLRLQNFFLSWREAALIWVSPYGCSVTKLCPTLCDHIDCSSQVRWSFTISWSLLKFMSNESMLLSNHLILCFLLLLLLSIFPSIRVFSNEYIRWPEYRSFSFSNSSSNE